jgi:hypothetical protein
MGQYAVEVMPSASRMKDIPTDLGMDDSQIGA